MAAAPLQPRLAAGLVVTVTAHRGDDAAGGQVVRRIAARLLGDRHAIGLGRLVAAAVGSLAGRGRGADAGAAPEPPPPRPAAEAAPIGPAAMNAAAIATMANPSTVERNGRCEVIGFSIQLLVEPAFPGEGD